MQLDQRRLSIKASNLELIDSHSDKEALGRRSVDRALKLGYMDPRRSSHVFGVLCARASAESEGANLYFTQLYEMDLQAVSVSVLHRDEPETTELVREKGRKIWIHRPRAPGLRERHRRVLTL